MVERDPIVRGIGWDGSDQSGSYVRVTERSWKYGDLPVDHGCDAHPSEHVLRRDLSDDLDVIHLVGHLLCGLGGHDPGLVAVSESDVLDIWIHPETDLSVDGLGSEGGGDEVLVTVFELEEGVLLSLRISSFGDIGLGGIDCDGAATRACGCEVGLLDEESLLVEFAELPLDELSIVLVECTGESAPVCKESESFPIFLDVHVAEEIDDVHGLGQLFEFLLGASVPEEVSDRTVVLGLVLLPDGEFLPNLVSEGDGSVSGSVCTDGEHDVVSGHTFVPTDRIDVAESSHMSYMEVSRHTGVCEDQHELRSVIPVGKVELVLRPSVLPFLLHCCVIYFLIGFAIFGCHIRNLFSIMGCGLFDYILRIRAHVR